MATRLSNQNLWQQDWFLSIEGKYQLFVLYLRDHCDHAGIWQPAMKMFEMTTGFRIKTDDFLAAVNAEKVQILVLPNGRWWLTGFCEDQYKGRVLCYAINPHKGAIRQLENNQVPYKSYGYEITLRKG
jgi:hypothetical protein